MKNVIVLSGLSGSGKTYVVDLIKEEVGHLMDVKWLGAAKDTFFKVVFDNKNVDELLIVELHPEFPDFNELKNVGVEFKHFVVSKDYTEYMNEISDEKKKFLTDWFSKRKRKNWLGDIVEYNKCRFEHVGHCKGDYVICDTLSDVVEGVMDFVENSRKKELFNFADENYGDMLYHSLNWNGIGYEGSAPTSDKYEDLKLPDLERGSSCLDVGCNIGYVSYLLEMDFGLDITAIDIRVENMDCALWLKQKFFRNSNINFDHDDLMSVVSEYDYVFALAVLHHVAKDHKFEDICLKLEQITKKACFIEINEMPDWSLKKIMEELSKYFARIEVIGNSRLPCSKKKANNRWIIHCFKGDEK